MIFATRSPTRSTLLQLYKIFGMRSPACYLLISARSIFSLCFVSEPFLLHTRTKYSVFLLHRKNKSTRGLEAEVDKCGMEVAGGSGVNGELSPGMASTPL
jgi:hypothetical protein